MYTVHRLHSWFFMNSTDLSKCAAFLPGDKWRIKVKLCCRALLLNPVCPGSTAVTLFNTEKGEKNSRTYSSLCVLENAITNTIKSDLISSFVICFMGGNPIRFDRGCLGPIPPNSPPPTTRILPPASPVSISFLVFFFFFFTFLPGPFRKQVLHTHMCTIQTHSPWLSSISPALSSPGTPQRSGLQLEQTGTNKSRKKHVSRIPKPINWNHFLLNFPLLFWHESKRREGRWVVGGFSNSKRSFWEPEANKILVALMECETCEITRTCVKQTHSERWEKEMNVSPTPQLKCFPQVFVKFKNILKKHLKIFSCVIMGIGEGGGQNEPCRGRDMGVFSCTLFMFLSISCEWNTSTQKTRKYVYSG